MKNIPNLNTPQSTIKSINRKWKGYATTTNLPKESHPPRLTDQESRALIGEATKKPKITLKETVVSVCRTTRSRTLHRAGLYGRVAGKSLKKIIRQNVWILPKGILETPQTYGGRYSGQIGLKFNFLAIKDNVISGANPTPFITLKTPSPP